MVGRAIVNSPFYWGNTDSKLYGTSNPGERWFLVFVLFLACHSTNFFKCISISLWVLPSTFHLIFLFFFLSWRISFVFHTFVQPFLYFTDMSRREILAAYSVYARDVEARHGKRARTSLIKPVLQLFAGKLVTTWSVTSLKKPIMICYGSSTGKLIVASRAVLGFLVGSSVPHFAWLNKHHRAAKNFVR